MKKYNTKVLSFIFLIISVSILIYIFYKDLFINKSKSFENYYSQYYILAITLLIFSIISFKLSKKFLTNITLSLISFFFGLYLIELYLSYNYHYKQKTINIDLKNYNQLNKFDLYLKLKKEGKDIVPRIDPNTYFTVEVHLNKKNFFPLSGISNKETLSCNELGYYSKYKSDKYGFNNENLSWNNNNIDVVLIGDSFANGSCVNRENNVGDNLIKDDLSVINLGFPGNGPLIELASLKEYAPRKFKNVVWLYYEGNDLRDLEVEEKNDLLLSYLLDKNFKQNLKDKQKSIDFFLEKKLVNIVNKEHLKKDLNQNMYDLLVSKEGKKFDFLRFIKLYTLREITINSFFGIKLNKKFEKIILEAKSFADENDAKFLFVYLPEHTRFTKKIYNMNSHLNYDQVKSMVEKNNISYLDLKEIFSEDNFDAKNLYATSVGGHFNIAGYKFLSDKIINKLKE